MEASEQRSLDLLRASLSEAQMTVRAYDTKAQIVGVGYMFALGIVGKISDLLPGNVAANAPTILAAWLVAIVPVVLFGAMAKSW